MTAALTHTTTADPPPVGDALPCDETPASPRRAAAETVRLYAADWNAFLAWCKSEDLAALPAAPATVAAFLQHGTATASAGTLARRAAAIAAQHRQAGRAPMPKAVTSHAARQ
jgi:site-specific recombinase XerD